ncbi:hypothetical protein DICPUDRAFT_146503 [Dictyostelium purpureum]|uniref:E3 ubiquitin protein ligase n=1 Tax=Dictyostelium purpureum TaxID=5786 RepID=F0Z650_DICPU|nr:uncharacterized protein DICPUDRAFT_146503 [Dictyostelium purpureum]EGC40592.1 hypothetical protein DICPUDRAFT_146503 [Dictyostelium purpureum]|eukprot:XP_003282928.1 hypothetical protein DICPUDRAFT_146503 [Dictyostelium purpureum]
MDQQQDLKRTRDPPNDQDGQRPSKKMSLSNSEASLPTGQVDQNLILFQNRAMKVRVEEQKLEINDREQKIKELNQKMHQYQENISGLCRVWDQLNNGLDLLFSRVDFENSLDSILPKETLGESFQFLSTFISEPAPLDDGYSIEQALQKKVQKTQNTFCRISKALEKEHTLSKFIFKLLKSKDGLKSNEIEKLLKEENDKLSKQNQYIQNIYDKFQVQYKQLIDQSSKLADQAALYQQTNKELKQELEKSQDELNIERKRVIKLQDETLRTPQIKSQSPSLGGTSNNGNGGSLNSSSNGIPNNKQTEVNGKELSQEEMITELQRQSDNRLLEARKLREEKAILLKELNQLQIDHRIIPEDRVTNSMPYQVLRQRYQLVADELDIHRNQCTKLQNDLQQATIGRRLEREAVESFEAHRRQQLDRRVQQLEGEAIELKAEKEKLIERIKQVVQRDVEAKNIEIKELLDKLSVFTKQNDELKLQENKLRDKEKELIIQINILKDQINNINNNNNNTNTNTTTNIITDTNTDNNNINTNTENKEEPINSLTTPTTTTSATNSLTLQQQEEVLEKPNNINDIPINNINTNNNNNNIDINNLENQEIYKLKLNELKLQEELEKTKSELKELGKLKENYNSEISLIEEKYKNQIKERDITISQCKATQESQRQEIEALIMEIDSMGKAYEQMLEQNTKLTKQLSDKEDTHAHLTAENIKSQQTIRLSKEQQLAMEEKLVRNEDKLKAQAELMQKIEEKSNILQKQLSKVTEDFHICNFDLEKHKRFVRENGAHSTELKTQLDHLNNLNLELKKKADDSIFALEREIDKAKRLDEEKQLLKRKLEKATTISTSSSSSSEEELKMVNQRLRCTICNDRQKNYVIAKCFHVFCRECIYSNIDTRKRRCPSCNRAFAETDVHQIYL